MECFGRKVHAGGLEAEAGGQKRVFADPAPGVQHPASSLPSKAAVHRLVAVTMAGLRPHR